ncbi:MAG: PRC-barrel domain-containing protein [Marinovum algicola]|uniref:PRC-barrel domain-containing protein n=1 Tax=Marinovum algicola TaxID=42444 RepID=UPI0032ECC55A
MTKALMTSALALAMAMGIGQAGAATQNSQAMDLKDWDRTALNQGWSAKALLDAEVFGPNNEEVGDVDDILIGPDGKIRAVIVETDAFLNIGDVEARIAWDRIGPGPEEESISVPLSEETIEEFRSDYDEVAQERRVFRARELIGDAVRVKDGGGYGRIDDLVFGRDGRIQAVTVNADYGYGYGVGPYAYPFYGYERGWQPGMGHYDLPFSRDQIASYEAYDRDLGGPFD